MPVELIVAMNRVGVIGRAGKLPWTLKTDLARFQRITTRLGAVVMGRRTHQSLGSLLPDRTNLVITTDPVYAVDGAVVVRGLDVAYFHHKTRGLAVIGGARVYRDAIGRQDVDVMHVTVVDEDSQAYGDVYFPDMAYGSPLPVYWPGWRITYAEAMEASHRDQFPYIYYTLERRAV